jgi:hypothetical protein
MPRYDTLVNVLRALDLDLVLVPRSLTPIVQSLVLEQSSGGTDDRPLYADDCD